MGVLLLTPPPVSWKCVFQSYIPNYLWCSVSHPTPYYPNLVGIISVTLDTRHRGSRCFCIPVALTTVCWCSSPLGEGGYNFRNLDTTCGLQWNWLLKWHVFCHLKFLLKLLLLLEWEGRSGLGEVKQEGSGGRESSPPRTREEGIS